FYGYGRVDLLSALTGPTPVVSSVSPASGPVGTPVTINGLDFTAASNVKFGLKNAGAFTVVNSGQVTTTVPAGATNGKVAVTTPGGTGLSPAPFQIVPDVSPNTGKAGDVITLSGPKVDETSAV